MTDYVYLIACDTPMGKLHKIGISINPSARLEKIKKEFIVDPVVAQTAILVTCFEHEDARKVERHLHERYQEFNFRFPQIVRGREWFLLDAPHTQSLMNDFTHYTPPQNEPRLRTSQVSPTFIPFTAEGLLPEDQLDKVFPPARQREFIEGLIKLMGKQS